MIRNSMQVVVCVLIAVLMALCAGGCAKQVRAGRLTVIISGNVEGYLRNCGCSAGQAGGELRKARIVKLEREDAMKPKPVDRGNPPAVVLLDTGNFSNSQSKVTSVQAAGVVRSMTKLNYDAVGLGLSELSYTQKDLLELLGSASLPLTAANLRFVKPQAGEDQSEALNNLLKPYLLVKQSNGYTVGVIHLVDLSVQNQMGKRNGFELSDPYDAACGVISAHGKEAALWILSIANAREDQADHDKLAGVPGITLLIGYRRMQPLEGAQATGQQLPRSIDPPFERAKDIVRVVVGYSPEGKVETVNAEEVMIPEDAKPDEYVQQIVDEVQPQLEKLANDDAEIEDQPGVHPRYVGETACTPCHAQIVQQLANSKHAQAYETLKAKDQQRSAACLPCHVTGYNKAGGWNILKNSERPEMRGVHCENCHGPGEYHVAIKTGQKAPADLALGGRDKFGLQPAGERTCLACHDAPNSPNYDFKIYWPKMKH
jgi:2',3'-cyclic-nucleotide 2'-phosphodiesterase (5'-nucleotidase family)